MVNNLGVSGLLLDELFDEAEPRFLFEILASTLETKLGGIARKWFEDARPVMRSMLLEYVGDGCDRPHHRALVKRLFKLAETAEDDELMARFLVAFDRMPRREMGTRRFYDYGAMELVTRAALVHSPDVPTDGDAAKLESRFSRRTRMYLARRAWRYFRRLAFRACERYPKAIAHALVHYRDEDLDNPAKLLDAWGLVHALYWSSPVLERPAAGVRLSPSHGLSDLKPAPFFAGAWAEARAELFGLAGAAQCRPVVTFAIEQLREHHADALASIDVSLLRPLIDSSRDETRRFAAELLPGAEGFDKLPIREWLVLLATRNEHALPALCEMFEAHVRPDRLSVEQCLALATARAFPVAQLGLRWLKQTLGEQPANRESLVPLLRAPLPAIREDAAAWMTGLLRTSSTAKPEDVRDLLDAPHAEVRQQALSLVDTDARFSDDSVLWAAMAESPHAEVQHDLVHRLSRSDKGSLAMNDRRHLWRSTLLAVRSGSRAKRHALRQVADALVAEPTQAELLLPLLRIALRSVRPPERRHALAAVARAAIADPELQATVRRVMPELQLVSAEAST